MKKKYVLITMVCMSLLAGCSSPTTTTETDTTVETDTTTKTDTTAETDTTVETDVDADNETKTSVEITKDFDGDSYSDTGEGVFLVVTSSGDSENGNVPVIYTDADTLLLQIGYKATEMNGGSLSYIYVDGMLTSKEQLSDSQGSLDLSGDSLTVGTHKVEVVQYENDATDGTVTTYKSASYEVKEN